MPLKRQRPSTPPKTNGKASSTKKNKKQAQPSIDSFFTSPSKPRPAINGTKKRETSVISIPDSDDDLPIIQDGPSEKLKVEGEDDAVIARRLAKEWAKQDGESSPPIDKGKGKAVEATEGEDDILALDAAFAPSPGVNGSSSSKYRQSARRSSSPLTPEEKPIIIDDSPKVKTETSIASMFKARPKSPPRTPKKEELDELKPIVTPTKGGTITSTTAEPVDAIDFDTDAFLFRPEDVDTSRWLKGRLPYSILVGVYVQVSSTRSRLMIVRVLTK